MEEGQGWPATQRTTRTCCSAQQARARVAGFCDSTNAGQLASRMLKVEGQGQPCSTTSRRRYNIVAGDQRKQLASRMLKVEG